MNKVINLIYKYNKFILPVCLMLIFIILAHTLHKISSEMSLKATLIIFLRFFNAMAGVLLIVVSLLYLISSIVKCLTINIKRACISRTRKHDLNFKIYVFISMFIIACITIFSSNELSKNNSNGNLFLNSILFFIILVCSYFHIVSNNLKPARVNILPNNGKISNRELVKTIINGVIDQLRAPNTTEGEPFISENDARIIYNSINDIMIEKIAFDDFFKTINGKSNSQLNIKGRKKIRFCSIIYLIQHERSLPEEWLGCILERISPQLENYFSDRTKYINNELTENLSIEEKIKSIITNKSSQELSSS